MSNQHLTTSKYSESKKMIKSFDKRKEKLLKENIRDQKRIHQIFEKITKIGQKVADRKKEIDALEMEALEMEFSLMKVESDEDKDEKKVIPSARASHRSRQVKPLSLEGELCVSFTPDGDLHTIREGSEGSNVS